MTNKPNPEVFLALEQAKRALDKINHLNYTLKHTATELNKQLESVTRLADVLRKDPTQTNLRSEFCRASEKVLSQCKAHTSVVRLMEPAAASFSKESLHFNTVAAYGKNL